MSLITKFIILLSSLILYSLSLYCFISCNPVHKFFKVSINKTLDWYLLDPTEHGSYFFGFQNFISHIFGKKHAIVKIKMTTGLPKPLIIHYMSKLYVADSMMLISLYWGHHTTGFGWKIRQQIQKELICLFGGRRRLSTVESN